MLDVHPIHAAARTWKEFLLQIATIATGLLIAIGLEQTVEYLHRRHQLQEARRELATELKDNREVLRINTQLSEKLASELKNDMAVLRAFKAGDPNPQPKLIFLSFHEAGFYWPKDGPWQTAKQSGSLSLMPHNELDGYVYVHEVVGDVMQALRDLAAQMNTTAAIWQRSATGALSASDAQDLIAAISSEQGKLALLRELLRFEGTGLDYVQR